MKVSWLRGKIRQFVVCDHFTRGILVAILVNTLSMGVEYHQQVGQLILTVNMVTFSLNFLQPCWNIRIFSSQDSLPLKCFSRSLPTGFLVISPMGSTSSMEEL